MPKKSHGTLVPTEILKHFVIFLCCCCLSKSRWPEHRLVKQTHGKEELFWQRGGMGANISSCWGPKCVPGNPQAKCAQESVTVLCVTWWQGFTSSRGKWKQNPLQGQSLLSSNIYIFPLCQEKSLFSQFVHQFMTTQHPWCFPWQQAVDWNYLMIWSSIDDYSLWLRALGVPWNMNPTEQKMSILS